MVYNCLGRADVSGRIPYPTRNEKVVSGYALAAVGYDDTIRVCNTNVSGQESVGTFLIKNS